MKTSPEKFATRNLFNELQARFKTEYELVFEKMGKKPLVFYDKANPRTEIWIYEYKEEEDEQKPDGFQN